MFIFVVMAVCSFARLAAFMVRVFVCVSCFGMFACGLTLLVFPGRAGDEPWGHSERQYSLHTPPRWWIEVDSGG